MDEVRYMISEAAKKLQVESHVLRYWEEELGLVIGRTDMGHRYYTEDDIQLFLCIQKLKNEGMLLRDLKFMIPELTAARRRLNAAKPENKSTADKVKVENVSAPDGAKSENEPVSGGQMNASKQENVPESNAKAVKKEASDLLAKTFSLTEGQADFIPEDQLEMESSSFQKITPAAFKSNLSESTSLKSASPESTPPASTSPASPGSAHLASASPTTPEADVIQVTQLEQVRSLIGDVLTDVVSANNETLKKDISRKVTTDVIREMDFLFQANERREEEHYRKLDVLIRQQQAGRREAARDTPLGKLKKLLT